MDERAFVAALAAAPGIGSKRLMALRDEFGSFAAIWDTPGADLCRVIGEKPGRALAGYRSSVDLPTLQDRLRAAGTQVIPFGDPEYPPLLAEIHDPPAMLFVRGQIPDAPSVAIVGTREATQYGLRVARRLAEDLVAAGVCVVSGLALGIDAAAHSGGIRRTVAVLGSGVDQIAPATNRPLAHRIVEAGGAVVSEYPLGTPPTPGQFPARNRIIAGLSSAVVVVEAKERSGALITAHLALDENREVMAVPGPIDSPHSAGPHRLIAQGARLVSSAADLLDELGWGGEDAMAKPAAEPSLEPGLAKVYSAVGSTPTALDAIGQESGLEPSIVMGALLELELKSLITPVPGGRYVRRL